MERPYTLKLPPLKGQRWCDKDAMFIQAGFELLIRYVDDEIGGPDKLREQFVGRTESACKSFKQYKKGEMWISDGELELSWAYAEMSMLSIYNWWKNYLKVQDGEDIDAMIELDENLDKIFNQLVYIKRFMWT